MPLTDKQKEFITASIPFLEENGVELTSRFYAYMLETYPEVRPFFNKSHQTTRAQPKILAYSVLQYAKNINDLTPLLGFVRQIVEKHVGLQVTPEQYDIVGTCLLKTLAEMLGDAATEEFIEAWKVAYFDLANILIGLEKERYATELKTENAWLGFKDATVFKTVQESDSIKSIYIKADDGKLAKFQPGQYITIRLETDNEQALQSREYSLSNEYSDLQQESGLSYYRISVKRIPNGVASNFIHDHVQEGFKLKITSPYGKLLEPALKSIEERTEEVNKPVVFFVGGIGITPSLSLVEYFLARGNDVKLFLSNSNTSARPFGEWVNKVVEKYPTLLQVNEYISKSVDLDSNDKLNLPTSADNYQVHQRRLDATDLSFFNKDNINDYNYFLVGPLGYMQVIQKDLSSKTLDISTINSEQFGPVTV